MHVLPEPAQPRPADLKVGSPIPSQHVPLLPLSTVQPSHPLPTDLALPSLLNLGVPAEPQSVYTLGLGFRTLTLPLNPETQRGMHGCGSQLA